MSEDKRNNKCKHSVASLEKDLKENSKPFCAIAFYALYSSLVLMVEAINKRGLYFEEIKSEDQSWGRNIVS